MSTDAVGGVWTYATELRAQLEARGVDVVLATLGPQAPPDDRSPHLPCRLEWQPDPWDDVAASGRWLLELAEQVEADVVHLNGFAHGAMRWPVPVVVAAHSCVLSWHEAVRGTSADASWARYRAAVAAGLRAADAVVAPTAAMRDALARHYDLARAATVIHNAIAPQAPPRRAKTRLVLGAGRLWDEAKGLAALDAAAARLPWPVAVAGDAGAHRARHARLLGALPRDELRALMAEAAIFAHPARYEPFGLVALEAAHAGCALVLGDIASLRELWDGAALFVAPGDAVALAEACARLIADEALRRDLADAARRRAQRFDAATMGEEYLRLYACVRERRKVPA